jgi:hypothetical protein
MQREKGLRRVKQSSGFYAKSGAAFALDHGLVFKKSLSLKIYKV